MDDPTRKLRLISQGLGLSDSKTLMAAAGLSDMSEIMRHAAGVKSALEQAGLSKSVLEIHAAARGEGSAFHAAQAVRNVYSRHALPFEAARALGSAYSSVLQVAEFARGPLSEVKQAALYNQDLFESFRARQQFMESFTIIRPNLDQVSQVAEMIAGIVKPHAHAFDQIGGWQRHLADRMGTIPSAWALADDLEFSGMAFGELTRLGATIGYDAPFSEEANEYVIEELGQLVEIDDEADEDTRERAYSAAGRNPDLVAFPRPAYGGVLIAAGFSFGVPAAPRPVAIANSDDSAEFDPEFYAALTHLEQHLRQFVQQQLTVLEGGAWLRRRVPGDMVRDWKLRQAEDEAAGRPVYEPIHYANFMDLADIICAGNNWREAFKPFFENGDAVRVALTRLHPMRKNTAHARPRTHTDMLYLAAEAHRLLRAMGILVSAN